MSRNGRSRKSRARSSLKNRRSDDEKVSRRVCLFDARRGNDRRVSSRRQGGGREAGNENSKSRRGGRRV